MLGTTGGAFGAERVAHRRYCALAARDAARGKCGVTVSADDAVALANAIERLCDDAPACARMGAHARAMFEAEFTQAIAMGKWRGVLAEVRA